jgi:hypothetical protein
MSKYYYASSRAGVHYKEAEESGGGRWTTQSRSEVLITLARHRVPFKWPSFWGSGLASGAAVNNLRREFTVEVLEILRHSAAS